MTRKMITAGAYVAAAVLSVAVAPRSLGQTAPAATPAAEPAANEEVVVLSPFVVSAADASDGYQVKDTLGGTRVRTDMSDVASAISVVSKKLLEDTGITNAQGLLVYTTNTEVAGLNGNFSGVSSRGTGVQGTAENGRLSNPNSINRSRGLTPMDNTRNYFISNIPWDSFNIDRVDISRGPNSFLFGVGSPSGIQNYSTNEGVFKDKGALELRYGSFGSSRESVDFNKVLLADELAVRIDLLNDDTKFQQKPAFSHTDRAYGALRYDPKFMNGGSAHTTIKVNAEGGRVRSNNPRELPPLDYITGYYDGIVNKAGYDPFAYAGKLAQNQYPGLSAWVQGVDIHYVWPGPGAAYWYDATTGANVNRMTTLNGANSNGTKTLANGVLSSMPQAFSMYTSGFANYAKAQDYRYIQANGTDAGSPWVGAYSGSVTYTDKSLTDSSIFDFYNKLIDGDNKREWQNWNTFNASVDQSFFNGRLSFQGVYDHQEFDYGNEGLLSGYMAPYISVDLNAYEVVLPGTMSGSVVNPNEGRPFIASDFGASNNRTRYVRDNMQLLANGEIRASDFLNAQSTLAKIIGTHSFTGLVGDYQVDMDTRTWTMYATDVAFANAMGNAAGLISSNRAISWVDYLGSSLVGTTTASGLNLSNMANTITPTSGTISHFDNTWTAASSVDPLAAWTNPNDPTGTYQQNDNPANYKGWTTIPVTVLNSKDNINDLYESGTKSHQDLESVAFMYQGKMFDDMLIPMFGWRKDKVKYSYANAPLDSGTSVASMNYDITEDPVIMDTQSRSMGVTLHLPKSLRGKLPLGSDLSLHYFHGANGTPAVRYAYDGSLIANESGKTDDYGFQLDTFNGKVTIRFTMFKTIDQNAAATGGAADPLGSNGYYLYLLPAWGAADAAATGLYVADSSNNGGGFAIVNGTTEATQIQKDAVADWKANFGKYFNQSFFDSYGLKLDMSAISSGNFGNVFPGQTGFPYPWNISNTGNGRTNGQYPIISQDIESKGWELETTVRPVNNWDITFNVSKVNAKQTALGESAVNLIMAEKAFFDGPAGLLPLWGYWGSSSNAFATADPTATLRYSFYQNIYSAYLLQTAQTGAAQPELRNWSAKAITNYTFSTGMLKGFNVGGGYRWASKPILGYGVSPITDSVTGSTMYLMDVNKPLKGRIDEHVDLWIGYSRKLTDKIDWHIQLNVQNVLESARLSPVSVEPDGSVAQYRILQGQTWTITNTFKF
jgi:hypothetical protein